MPSVQSVRQLTPILSMRNHNSALQCPNVQTHSFCCRICRWYSPMHPLAAWTQPPLRQPARPLPLRTQMPQPAARVIPPVLLSPPLQQSHLRPHACSRRRPPAPQTHTKVQHAVAARVPHPAALLTHSMSQRPAAQMRSKRQHQLTLHMPRLATLQAQERPLQHKAARDRSRPGQWVG